MVRVVRARDPCLVAGVEEAARQTDDAVVYLAVDLACSTKTDVSAEAVQGSMTAVVYFADLAGSLAAAWWRTVCGLATSCRTVFRFLGDQCPCHRQAEVASSLCAQLALVPPELQDCRRRSLPVAPVGVAERLVRHST